MRGADWRGRMAKDVMGRKDLILEHRKWSFLSTEW